MKSLKLVVICHAPDVVTMDVEAIAHRISEQVAGHRTPMRLADSVQVQRLQDDPGACPPCPECGRELTSYPPHDSQDVFVCEDDEIELRPSRGCRNQMFVFPKEVL